MTILVKDPIHAPAALLSGSNRKYQKIKDFWWPGSLLNWLASYCIYAIKIATLRSYPQPDPLEQLAVSGS
jgi:hypothetical protein